MSASSPSGFYPTPFVLPTSSKIDFAPPSLAKKMEERGDKKFKILAISGGGIRGIIPLKICVALEKLIGPLHETFDLIAGTSTGGIITLGLTAPTHTPSAEDILKIYQERSGEIFIRGAQTSKPPKKSSKLWSHLLDRPIYRNSGIKRIANEILGVGLMKDAATNILIPALDVTDRVKNILFSNRDPAYALLAMRDVACATSAAPMYFPRKTIHFRDYVDGGIGCNNPAFNCHYYALQNGVSIDSQYLLSLGTGFASNEGVGGRKEHHSLIYWAKNIFSAFDSALSNTADEELHETLGDRYWSFNPSMEHEIELDNHSKEAIKELQDIGDALVEESAESLRNIAKILRPDKL